MTVTDFIVAIELGSTDITGVAGRKNNDGSIQILAYASEHSSDCIKKGVIYNSNKTEQCLTSILHKLEEQTGASIKKAYVGIGGQSMYSVENYVSRQFSEETKISQALVDSLMKTNREMALPDKEILAVQPQEYRVGKDFTSNPVGISAESIEGHFLNIIARRSLKDKIKQCFRQSKCEVADYLLAPLATADAVLTDNEKRSGCALVDLGAETTTVSIYKNNILRHVAVIPLGGNNITKDICSIRIDMEDAEQLKLRFACAYTEPADDEDANEEYSLDGKITLKAQDLEKIVEARVNEIIKNVQNQIKLSHYGDDLLAGIVLTGGAANMPNMDEAFRQITKIEKVRLAKGSEVALNGLTLPKDGTCSTLIGLLVEGKENCCRVDPKRNSQLDFINDLEEQKQEEDAEKIKQEEIDKQNRIKRIQEENERQEKERIQRRLDECDGYLTEAKNLSQRNEYKKALKEIEKARLMNIPEKMEEIDNLENEISQQKKEDSWLGKFAKKITNAIDESMKD